MFFRNNFYPIVFTALSVLAVSCNEKPAAPVTEVAMAKADSTKPKFTKEMIDNKKDPSCGMPISTGIEDTVHYAGKVYGFCSNECKQEFLKNPAAMAKTAEMK